MSAGRDLRFKNPGRHLDHRILHTLEHLLVSQPCVACAQVTSEPVDQLLDILVERWRVGATFHICIAIAALLTEAACFVQRIRSFRFDAALRSPFLYPSRRPGRRFSIPSGPISSTTLNFPAARGVQFLDSFNQRNKDRNN